MRELLEKTGLLVIKQQPFGYQKTSVYNIEYIFECSSIFHFQEGEPQELHSLKNVHRKNFVPIDNSSKSMNPWLVYSEEEFIRNIYNMEPSHKMIVSHYLLKQKDIQKRISENQFDFLLRTAKIRY
jgi:hypothetical protein